MSSDPAKSDSGKKKPLRYAAIVGSLAVLGIILSPISPFAQSGPPSGSLGTLEDDPQPEDISDEDAIECTSLIQGVEYVIVGGRLQPIPDEEFPDADEQDQVSFNLTSQEKLASDTLLGEFCNRPALVANLSNAYDPTVNLVAFGCEAASGKMGDVAMQDSIEDYEDIYCSSAIETIEYEILSWTDSIEIFRSDVIPAAREQSAGNATRSALIEEAELIVANASDTVLNAQDLLDSGRVYDAANSLDGGISAFTLLIEREDMAFLLEL